MDISVLADIQRWYYSQSDGDWEHCYGIKIDTLDHPGWQLSIDLEETDMEEVPFAEVQHNEMGHQYGDDPDWFVCRKAESKFVGYSGPEQLESMLRVFMDWVHLQQEIPAVSHVSDLD